MKILAVVENTSKDNLKAGHGLSLYIETKIHKLLFDLGPDGDLLLENANALGINLDEIDTVILSHGHYDHGGALGKFLEINNKAKVYAQSLAFEPHIKIIDDKVSYIGIDAKLKSHEQVVCIDSDYVIDGELEVFTARDGVKCMSEANSTLYDNDGRDKFYHEQNLIIKGDGNTLIMGCGHSGIINILEKAKPYNINLCVGGFHLYNPTLKKTVSKELLDEILKELEEYSDVTFYTCHCTGIEAYEYLSNKMSNLKYISCGECI